MIDGLRGGGEVRGVMERWNGGCGGEMEWRGVMERWNGGV